MFKVLIVDDDDSFRSMLKKVLELEDFLTSEATEGSQSLEIFKSKRPNVVLLDLKMPGMDGMEVFHKLRAIDPRVPVVILTGHGDILSSFEAGKLGIHSFMAKPPDFDELVITIKEATAKKISTPLLSERQIEVLQLVACGKKSHEIARDLGIVKRTVKFHLDEAMSKLEAASKAQAVALAVSYGLIDINTNN